jgi:hypothetical protein
MLRLLRTGNDFSREKQAFAHPKNLPDLVLKLLRTEKTT